MIDLKKYYNDRVRNLEEINYLKQVGHSVGGVAISDYEFGYLVEEVIKGLELSENDTLLDLCCGNGVITHQLSQYCLSVLGVDFSHELIGVARKHFPGDNIEYIKSDVFDIESILQYRETPTKILMFGALQHFKVEDLLRIITLIKSACHSEFKILLGFIPDLSYKWNFYNSAGKKLQYVFRRIIGKDIMGTWWSRSEIERSCMRIGVLSQFIEIPKKHYGSPYRFHVLISNGEIR